MRTAISLTILVAPLLATAVAAILYAIGGFGGGHGPYDEWIYGLGFPAIFLLETVPGRWLDGIWEPVWLIVLPGCANFFLFASVAAIVHRALHGREHPTEQSD